VTADPGWDMMTYNDAVFQTPTVNFYSDVEVFVGIYSQNLLNVQVKVPSPF